MKTRRSVLTAALLPGLLTLGAANAIAQEVFIDPTAFPPSGICLPGIKTAFNQHAAVYTQLQNTLTPKGNLLRTQLANVQNQATYATLLATANTIANSIPNGRMLVTLPDGTVVLDTSKNNNTYANFQNKAINENHNSRAAIIAAQLWPCGVGIESKLSSTTGSRETYFALRLGSHLDNEGTARLSRR